MTIAFDAATVSADNTSDFNFNHTPVGTPRAALVIIIDLNASSDDIVGVTYGGTSMTQTTDSPLLGVNMARSWHAFFLGASVPTGTQSVAVDKGVLGNAVRAYVFTFTAAGDCAVEDTGTLDTASVTNPSITLTTSVATAIVGALESGQSAVSGVAVGSNFTQVDEQDEGARVTNIERGTSNFSAGSPVVDWTAGAAAALAFAVAIKEDVLPPVTVNQAPETDTSQAVAWAPKHRLITQAAEADTAGTTTALRADDVAQASETDTAQAVTPRRTEAVSQASETDTAGVVSPVFPSFPTIFAVRHTHVTGNATSTNILVPDGSNVSGYLVIAFASKDGTGVFTWPSGWTQIVAASDDSNLFCRTEVRYRIIDGTEGWDGTDDVIAVTHASEETACSVITYSSWHGTTPPEGATVGDAGFSNTNPNPPSLDPSAWATEDTSWIAYFGSDATRTVSGFPTGYDNNQHADNTGGISGITHGFATRNLNAASENPGTFTLDSNDFWVAVTVAVRPVSVGATPVGQSSESDTAQAVAWAPKSRFVAQASETDTGRTITPHQGLLVAVGQALETDTARPIFLAPRVLVQALETDRAKQVDIVGGLVPISEVPVLIRAPLRAGRIFHEVSFQGDTYHPNIAGFQSEETAPGGFGPATGRISERIFRAHRDIMRAGAHWLVWHEDGTCLHSGKLLEPDTSDGEVQLTDRGTSSLADREVGPILYQAAVGDEMSFMYENVTGWQGTFPKLLLNDMDTGLQFQRRPDANGGQATIIIPFFGRQLAYMRFDIYGYPMLDVFDQLGDLLVETARKVTVPSESSSAELDISNIYVNWEWRVTYPDSGEIRGVAIDLTLGDGDLPTPNTSVMTNDGDPDDTGVGFVYPECVIIQMQDGPATPDGSEAEINIKNLEINGVAVGERRAFSAHDLVADISAVLGIRSTTLEGGGFDILPYELPAGVPASEALDYASLVSGKMWRLRHNGTRAVMEFGVSNRWSLASPWSPFDAIPQERFDAVAVPYTYAGTNLDDQVIVRVENSPLDRKNVYWGLALAAPAHNADKARSIGGRIADELVRKRNAGTFAAAELIDADGNKTTAHHCFAGDSIQPMRAYEPGRLRISQLTRFEDHIEGSFDGELHALDRMLARREKRMSRRHR
jgi:hypothetical protein